MAIAYKYDFYSGTTVGVWIGDILVMEAAGVEFSLVQLKTPVWGYASALYDGVAAGIIQVQGNLFVNFTEPQLLPTLIARVQGIAVPEESYVGWTPEEASRVVSYAPTERKKTKAKADFWGSPRGGEVGTNYGVSGLLPYGRPDQHSKSFDIIITYGKPFESMYSTKPSQKPTRDTFKILKGVHITGAGQEIRVSGEPIQEMYPFLARTVT